jgi:hypothetical protein
MISGKTAAEVHRVLYQWALEKKLQLHEVFDLLEQIGRVPGNKSFTDSLVLLRAKMADVASVNALERALETQREPASAGRKYVAQFGKFEMRPDMSRWPVDVQLRAAALFLGKALGAGAKCWVVDGAGLSGKGFVKSKSADGAVPLTLVTGFTEEQARRVLNDADIEFSYLAEIDEGWLAEFE